MRKDYYSKVSVYIPCYNCAETVAKTIEAVLAQTHPVSEVIAIYDNSSDNTLEVLRNYPVKVVENKVCKGLAAARNVAIGVAKGDFIASLDADCVPEPDWLEKLMANFHDEKVAGVGGKLMESTVYGIADRWRAVHMKQHWGNKKEINPSFLFGNNNVFKKTVFGQVGYYDENFKVSAEDYEFSQRVKKSGHKIVYEPLAIVKHLKTDTIQSVLTTYWKYGAWAFQRNLWSLLRRIISHAVTTVNKIKNDILSLRFSFIMVDLILFVLLFYYDVKLFCTGDKR